MTAKQILLYLLEYTYEREGAYPPLDKALAGVTAAQASWKPAPARHSIWQIVRHMTQWMEAGICAIEAEPQDYEDLEKSDWQPATGDESEWQTDVERLHRAYRQLKERLTAMSDGDLGGMIEPYRGKPKYEAAFRFIRTATHDTYHLGQIRYLHVLQWWSFDPPYPSDFESSDRRVLLIGEEPRHKEQYSGQHDMGYWFRTAIDQNAHGNDQFLERNLLLLEALVLPRLAGLWSNWRERKDDVRITLLPHLRYADLKAEEGTKDISRQDLANWVGSNLHDVINLFVTPPPHVVVLLGRKVAWVFVEKIRDKLIAENINFEWIGMPHPSATEDAPIEGAKGMRLRTRRLTDSAFRWSEAGRNWVPILY